jgi:hypothetical protein
LAAGIGNGPTTAGCYEDPGRASYTGRHTYISLQVHAGLSPVIVAALAGNSPEVLWKHDAREFDRSRTTKAVSLEAALRAARRQVAQSGRRMVTAQPDVVDITSRR